MSEKVERVKAAIAAKLAPAIDVRAPYAKVMFEEAARAAIEAMPTEDQREAARDVIEAEARAYVDSYGDHYTGGTLGAFDYLRAMLKVIDRLNEQLHHMKVEFQDEDGMTVLRAEITKWRADYTDTATCLGNERQRAGELLRERDAEVARLTAEREVLNARYSNHGHDEPCLICGKPCNGLAGNPSLWPLRLGNNGWHHTGCVNDALRELDRLRAPPGADVMARLHPIMVRYYALGADKRMSDEVAALIQQYGDERAAERDAEIARLRAPPGADAGRDEL